MKWIGQNIYDQISRFRNKVFFEGDVEFNTDTITFQSANADDPIVTIKNTSNAQNDMASLKFVKDRGATPGVGDNLAEIYFIGEDADQNSQEYGRILCETDVVTGGQESGVIKMGVANHDGGNGYGLIITGGSVDDEVDVTVGLGAASLTTIAGDLSVTTGLILDSVDVTTIQTSGEPFADNDTSLMTSASINDRITSFGYGDITSVVAGTNITGGGTSGDVTLNVATASDSAKGVVELATTAETTTGTDAARAVTPDGLKDGYRGSTNVTTVGTIGTGVWQGTAIATAYIADDAVTENKLANTLLAEIDANTAKSTNRAYFEFKGYGSSDGTNYEMPEIISDNNAPFIHDTSTGSDGLTAQTTNVVMRQGGVVMPYTGVLKKFTGWVTTAGTGTVDVGIFKFTPVDNNAGNVTPVLLVNEQITGAGNTKMRSFSETSSFDAGFTAGDIIYSAVLGSGSSKSWYLNSTLEVEWS